MYWIIRGEGNGVCIKNLMKLIIVLALVIVSTSSLFTYAYEPTEASNENVNNNFKVCIDPGHQAKYDSRGSQWHLEAVQRKLECQQVQKELPLRRMSMK